MITGDKKYKLRLKRFDSFQAALQYSHVSLQVAGGRQEKPQIEADTLQATTVFILSMGPSPNTIQSKNEKKYY